MSDKDERRDEKEENVKKLKRVKQMKTKRGGRLRKEREREGERERERERESSAVCRLVIICHHSSSFSVFNTAVQGVQLR